VDTLDYEAYREAIDDRIAYVHCETIGTPPLVTPELERLADIAHEGGVPLFVDNIFATPSLCRPLEHGADLVWESTTKWLHGHGATIGGALIDGGTFPWAEHADRFPEIAGDNPAYHGVNFAERFGDAAFTYAAIARALRDLGRQQSPFDAWMTLQGIETLGRGTPSTNRARTSSSPSFRSAELTSGGFDSRHHSPRNPVAEWGSR
jgi:O-acetylhomoserine (thiol)-lyase